MKIAIQQKIAPFSHEPGMVCIFPGTHVEFQAFPTLLRLGRGKFDLFLHLHGPVRGFTVQLDLEKNAVFVFGEAKEGFYRLRLRANDAGIELFADRVPEEGIAHSGTFEGVLRRKETLFFPMPIAFYLPSCTERLSLGSHKAQDWWGVLRRFDLCEILPPLFALGQRLPPVPVPLETKGTIRLLDWPRQTKEDLLLAIEIFCRAAFSKMLVPRLKDEEHQGLCSDEPVSGNRFFLLQEAYRRLRALFFRAEDRRIFLTPCNPFEAGRLTCVREGGLAEFDLEWSRHLLRRAICRPLSTGDLLIGLPTPLKSFRVRRSEREKGKRYHAAEPLFAEAGQTYLLDCFQK